MSKHEIDLTEDTESTITVDRAVAENIDAAARPDNLSGKTLAQKYEIIELLGEGGMSVVYRARHTAIDKTVAVKILHMHLAKDDVSLRRFKQEAQASSSLTHPGIVSVHDYGESEDGMPYLVMDYIEGKALSELIKEEGPLELERFLSIMQQVSAALAHAHDTGVVHRDLKPSNIMITSAAGKEQVKIVDFGIAKIMSQAKDGAQQLTQTGEIFGSPVYMSPEQCSGQQVDRRSDIYSMGCVMFEALSGSVPHKGATVVATIHMHMQDPPPPLVAPQIADTAKQKLELMLLRCLAKLPDERYQSMHELESELRSLSLKSKGGLLGSLSSAWDLASAKRRAARQSKMPILVVALSTSLLSVLMLLFGLHQADIEIAKLGHSRKVIMEICLAQSSLLLLAESTRNYMSAVMLHPNRLEGAKAKFNKRSQLLKNRLDLLEKALGSDPEAAIAITKSQIWRATLDQVPNESMISAQAMESSQNLGIIGISTSSIAIATHLSEVCQNGAEVLDAMSREAARQEQLQMKAFQKTKQSIGLLSILCAAINGTVIVSLMVYFARGTGNRLRKLSENALVLSKQRGLAAAPASQDEVADLDNVLQELATALSEAEEREKQLLLKIRDKEKTEEHAQESPISLNLKEKENS